jgi:hypothetical protein
MVLANGHGPEQALKQKSLDAGRHTKPYHLPIKSFLLEPSPLELNQPPDQEGQPALIRLDRRKTAHSLPCRAV